MRKFLLLLLVILTMSIFWIIGGRQISEFVDQFGTIKTKSTPIETVTYQTVTGGFLVFNNLPDPVLGLEAADPRAAETHIGTTKAGELAVSIGGKVFPFGPLQSDADKLAISRPTADTASISVRHGALCWPILSGKGLIWKRHRFFQLNWRKQNGMTLNMLWRFEQTGFSLSWPADDFSHEGLVGLIRVEISDAAR